MCHLLIFAQALSEHDVDLATSSLVALLADSDSYVYLSALTALSRLADLPSMRGRVFQYLLKAFSCGPPGQAMTSEKDHTHTIETSRCEEERSEGQSVCVSTRHRALLGEALGTLLRRAGDAAPPLVPHLVAVCVRVARTPLSKEEESSLEGFADLRTMTLIRPITDANSTSSNEVTDPTSSLNKKKEEQESAVKEEQRQQQQQAATAAAAVAGDSVFLRQSALSLLADAVVCSGWGASKYLIDIVDVATGVLAMEGKKFSTQASSSSRRYAPTHPSPPIAQHRYVLTYPHHHFCHDVLLCSPHIGPLMRLHTSY
jgi:Required for nuclear transport of RNA pol II C-terminus 1